MQLGYTQTGYTQTSFFTSRLALKKYSFVNKTFSRDKSYLQGLRLCN